MKIGDAVTTFGSDFVGKIIDISSEYAPGKRLVAIAYPEHMALGCSLWDNKFPSRPGYGHYVPEEEVEKVAYVSVPWMW